MSRTSARRVRAGEEPERRQRGQHVAADDDAPAVVVVRDVTGDEREADGGQENGEPDQPERERAARDVVHQPADRDVLDLHGHRGEEPSREEQPQVAVAQDAEGRQRRAHVARGPAPDQALVVGRHRVVGEERESLRRARARPPPRSRARRSPDRGA